MPFFKEKALVHGGGVVFEVHMTLENNSLLSHARFGQGISSSNEWSVREWSLRIDYHVKNSNLFVAHRKRCRISEV